MLGEMQRGMQHAGHTNVVDVGTIAEREFSRFVLRAAGSDHARQRNVERLAFRHRFDRVEHLHVARATTQVCTEVTRHVVALEPRALLVDLRHRPHHDAGNAESALQATAGGERVGVLRAFRLSDAFQRGH